MEQSKVLFFPPFWDEYLILMLHIGACTVQWNKFPDLQQLWLEMLAGDWMHEALLNSST